MRDWNKRGWKNEKEMKNRIRCINVGIKWTIKRKKGQMESLKEGSGVKMMKEYRRDEEKRLKDEVNGAKRKKFEREKRTRRNYEKKKKLD